MRVIRQSVEVQDIRSKLFSSSLFKLFNAIREKSSRVEHSMMKQRRVGESHSWMEEAVQRMYTACNSSVTQSITKCYNPIQHFQHFPYTSTAKHASRPSWRYRAHSTDHNADKTGTRRSTDPAEAAAEGKASRNPAGSDKIRHFGDSISDSDSEHKEDFFCCKCR